MLINHHVIELDGVDAHMSAEQREQLDVELRTRHEQHALAVAPVKLEVADSQRSEHAAVDPLDRRAAREAVAQHGLGALAHQLASPVRVQHEQHADDRRDDHGDQPDDRALDPATGAAHQNASPTAIRKL